MEQTGLTKIKRLKYSARIFAYSATFFGFVSFIWGVSELRKLEPILRNMGTAKGTIYRSEPRNHNTVWYTYEVEGREYKGVGRGVCNCENESKTGDVTTVYYQKDKPENQLNRHPAAEIKNAQVTLIVGPIVMPLLMAALSYLIAPLYVRMGVLKL